MKFIVLRLLTHSELGMFHEYRRQGKERAKQRAINFDWDVVDKVFPSAKDTDIIPIECRRPDDSSRVVQVSSWLKRQHRNWRFEGDCPIASYYSFVDPGVMFAMVVDASTTPAQASWVVLPLEHPARTAILNHGESARLGQSAMIAMHGDEGVYCHSVLIEHFPQLFEKAEAVSLPSSGKIGGSDDVAPDPLGLFKILARAGHSLPSAVADLVDNSLSNEAREIDITFPNPNDGGRWMCIRDDGTGMTPEGLRNAMKIGHQRNYDDSDLGKFGYGLKGAAWSQADRLTVVSKVEGDKTGVLTWDKDHLAKTRRWELLSDPVAPMYSVAVDIGNSGTAVLLTQMRPTMEPIRGRGESPYALELAAIKAHLELVFHRYLEGKVPGREKVTIRLNGEPLRANNPMGHPLTKVYEERRIELPPTSEKVPVLSVRAYVTPNETEFEDFIRYLPPQEQRVERDRLTLSGRANDAQGFYFYRLNRLIKWGGWEDIFAKDEHTKLLRVAVDFDRLAEEQLQVDISKQLIRLPFAVADLLKEVLKAPRAAARSRYDKKTKPSEPRPTAGGKWNAPVSPLMGPTATYAAGSVTFPAAGSCAINEPTSVSAPKKDKAALRLVSIGTAPWVRKLGFSGEHVEITPQVPELVTLVQAIEKDADAKAALSEFLRALETAGVLDLLAGKP